MPPAHRSHCMEEEIKINQPMGGDQEREQCTRRLHDRAAQHPRARAQQHDARAVPSDVGGLQVIRRF
eukprot:scaffold194960_cov31-Tisochrysis_lutea.AAC.1